MSDTASSFTNIANYCRQIGIMCEYANTNGYCWLSGGYVCLKMWSKREAKND